MKILITGGAGFIGSHINKLLLDKGHTVLVYDNLSRGFKELIDPRAEFILGALNEKEKLERSLQGVDAVIHMAAYIIVPESVEKPLLYIENNVLGTAYLLEAMKKASVKKIILSSSATVYGEPDSLPLTEEAPIKQPANTYGFTKLTMENLLGLYYKTYEFDTIILRYFNPYGPNEMHNPETHAIPNFIKSTLLKKPIPLYWQGEQLRDFIYVEDLALAHIAVLDLEGYQVFNVGTEVGTKVIDVVNKIFEIVGYKVEFNDLGERLGDVKANYASSEKLRKSVGWRARTSLDEGLRKTIDFFKSKTGS
ncbi:MAG: hypothetical protein A2Y57_01655 [Candidatus Woykebacteria bacterium RBG_13_40_7b]|uniref:UDP-glucose 4-epimerase n=1 Tax=Candidatus Woykebacteria bacterium RBG_13_40_7b TaxID=1802594 RepID=A0A1G1W785_9BACT|nr:MAG: hypothetical protein A2Y57_01655 [Candidatus Woykebacteria bacterium RBG_13_40_7b]